MLVSYLFYKSVHYKPGREAVNENGKDDNNHCQGKHLACLFETGMVKSIQQLINGPYSADSVKGNDLFFYSGERGSQKPR